jgi:hypothetical protein
VLNLRHHLIHPDLRRQQAQAERDGRCSTHDSPEEESQALAASLNLITTRLLTISFTLFLTSQAHVAVFWTSSWSLLFFCFQFFFFLYLHLMPFTTLYSPHVLPFLIYLTACLISNYFFFSAL